MPEDAGLAAAEEPLPRFHNWDDYRRMGDWELPKADTWGFHRVKYPQVDGSAMYGHVVRVLPGQASPEQSHPVDIFFVAISGEVELYVGSTIYALRPHDLLKVDAGTPYRYLNVGFSDALFFNIFAKPDGTSETSREAGGAASGTTGQRAGNDPTGGITHMRWEEYRRELNWSLVPKADVWGFHRGDFPMMRSEKLNCHTVRHPAGQSSPWHALPGDNFIMVLLGELEVRAAGRVFILKPLDVVWIPGNLPYKYSSVGQSEALIFGMFVKWPGYREKRDPVTPAPGSTYYDPEPTSDPWLDRAKPALKKGAYAPG